MAIYGIGDLHLSFGVNKPMNIFGENWANYEKKISENWLSKINEEDVVLLPGDFSWAMYIGEAKKDFEFIDNLPGTKILLKGNHDFWWTTLNKMQEFVEENKYKKINFLYNNSVETEEAMIVGTRGWYFSESDNGKKMLNRELIRLELSIKDALKKMKESKKEKKIICIMHYPPITKNIMEKGEESPYLELLKKYNIDNCYYGHLHGQAHEEAVEGTINGVKLKLISSDYIKFDPVKIM